MFWLEFPHKVKDICDFGTWTWTWTWTWTDKKYFSKLGCNILIYK